MAAIANIQDGANSINKDRDNIRCEEAAPTLSPNGDALPIGDASEPEVDFVVEAVEGSLVVVGAEADWRVELVADFVAVDVRCVAVVEDTARFFLGAKPIRLLSRSNTE